MQGGRDVAIAGFLGLFALLVFNANLRAITAADTYAARYLPFSILENRTVLLNPILDTMAQGRQWSTVQGTGRGSTAFWIVKGEGDNYVSHFPIVLPVILSPIYAPAVAYLDARGWDPHHVDRVARVMEKLCASLIAAASVGLLYLLLRRRAPPGAAALLAAIYAFGTTTWVISSQALWTHGLAQLLIVAAMLIVTGQRTVMRILLVGLLCGLVAANRPPDLVLAGAIGLAGLWWAGWLAPLLIVAALVPTGLTAAYNLIAVGHLGGAYALLVKPSHYNDDVIGGVAGLLFSPTRGLFVFSPFLLFVPLFLMRALRASRTPGLDIAIVLALVVQLVGYALIDWRQGISWGPRWLTDGLPLLMWLLAPIFVTLSRPGRVVFGAASAAAITIQAIGAFWYTGATDTAMLATEQADRMRPMWEVRNAAFIGELRHPPAPADLFRLVRGNIDLIEVIDVVVPDGTAGDRIERQVDVAGWVLADNRTPADVAVLFGGHAVAGTTEFFVRPDVVEALGVPSPAGWRLRFAADRLPPGTHRIAVVARADRGGEPRLIRTRHVVLPPDSPAARQERLLARAAGLAVRRLEARQQAEGYWLTAFTPGHRFERPAVEMNTYLTAVMLDIVGPVEAPGLAALLDRARAHLTRQIEADGLVRYHGRPDAPTIGVLGCAITPDSDDTALAWRVAPGQDRGLLAQAIGTMRRFRTEDGLYRTWLAARDDYRCLDPGRDPNPADIAIQMHVLLLLAEEEPAAAAELCRALTGRAGEDALWVYYADAPPMVILRLADMARAGCPLVLPDARLRTDVPGQDRWVRAAQLLWRLQADDAAPPLLREATGLLRELAADDFAVLAGDPPLLYHNDLTATVRRFYWSEDFAYALWLRLDHERRRLARRWGCDGDDAPRVCGAP